MKFTYKNEIIEVRIAEYINNQRPAIQLFRNGFYFSNLSSNLPEQSLGKDEFFVKSYHLNCPLRRSILNLDLFENTGKVLQGSFVDFQIWRINDKINYK